MDLNNETDWKRLEQQAYNGTVDFSKLPPAAYRYFSELTKLYYAFRFEGLPQQDANLKKQKLLQAYREAVRVFEQAREACREQQDNIRKIGTLRTEIAREPDERERLRLCIQAIGVMTGDKVFQKTELERMEETDHA